MSEISNLLNQSILEFKDKKDNAMAIPCTYLPALNGLAYLIKETAIQKLVSVAIHLSTDIEQREDGIYNTGTIIINTQINLFEQFELTPDVIIIDYKNFILGISRSGEFNAITNTFHYIGEILLNRNDKFIILDEDEASTLILSDSTTLWLDLADPLKLNIPIYPSFISTINQNTTYMTISINESIPLNNVNQPDDSTLQQFKRDTIKIHLINSTLQQAQDLAKNIFEAPLKYQTFGIQNFIGWRTINEYNQKSFGIKQNIRAMDITINYQLRTNSSAAIKYFKQIAATINGEKISTPLLP